MIGRRSRFVSPPIKSAAVKNPLWPRRRGDETFVDHGLSLALWILPILMFPLGFAHIPSALLVLPLFTARLLWRLANGTSKQASLAAALAST